MIHQHRIFRTFVLMLGVSIVSLNAMKDNDGDAPTPLPVPPLLMSAPLPPAAPPSVPEIPASSPVPDIPAPSEVPPVPPVEPETLQQRINKELQNPAPANNNDGSSAEEVTTLQFLENQTGFGIRLLQGSLSPAQQLDMIKNAWKAGEYTVAIGMANKLYNIAWVMPQVREVSQEIYESMERNWGTRKAYHISLIARGLLNGTTLYTDTANTYKHESQVLREIPKPGQCGIWIKDPTYVEPFNRACILASMATGVAAEYIMESAVAQDAEKAIFKLLGFTLQEEQEAASDSSGEIAKKPGLIKAYTRGGAKLFVHWVLYTMAQNTIERRMQMKYGPVPGTVSGKATPQNQAIKKDEASK